MEVGGWLKARRRDPVGTTTSGPHRLTYSMLGTGGPRVPGRYYLDLLFLSGRVQGQGYVVSSSIPLGLPVDKSSLLVVFRSPYSEGKRRGERVSGSHRVPVPGEPPLPRPVISHPYHAVGRSLELKERIRPKTRRDGPVQRRASFNFTVSIVRNFFFTSNITLTSSWKGCRHVLATATRVSVLS